MATKWSFNRKRDFNKISKETFYWKGPFCLPKLEKKTNLNPIPDISGVYIFCFPKEKGFVLEAAGITKSMKQRMSTHLREYRKGNYNIFDMDAIKNCERIEIWHGWAEAKKNREEFENNKEYYSKAIERQLQTYRVFVTEVPDLRKRERIEAAIMINAYVSKEPWADLAPRWMHLRGRYNYEMPIKAVNISDLKIYGLPNTLEI